MLKTVSTMELIELGVKTRFGPDWPGKRCLAKNRKGSPCQCPAMKGGSRCRLHGGKSTGARTPQGKERVRATSWLPHYSIITAIYDLIKFKKY